MPCWSGTITPSGLYVPVRVIAPQSGLSRRVEGLVDTAAAISCISSSLVSALGLEPVGKEAVLTVGGGYEGATHLIDLEFPVNSPGSSGPSTYTIRRLPCLELSVPRRYELLLGWDLMVSAHLILNGPGGHASICF